MSTGLLPTAMLLTLLWPALLALLLLYPPTLGLARRLLPLVALPALLLALLPLAGGRVELPGVLLDSALLLDGDRQHFLLLGQLLSMPAAMAPAGYDTHGRRRVFELLFLLFIGALSLLVLAADAVLFFSAGTLAGYALYGMLVCESDAVGHRGTRVLVVMLVIADLVIFELLLMLAQLDVGMEFGALREAWPEESSRATLLTLMLLGFGVKAGVVGLHYWLAPVWLRATTALRLALIAFVFSAGVLPWWLLLPPDGLHWPAAAEWLSPLALLLGLYAAVAGLLQSDRAAAPAYLIMVLGAVWLAVVALLPGQPASVALLGSLLWLQSALALAMLLLLPGWFGAINLLLVLLFVQGAAADGESLAVVIYMLTAGALLLAGALLRWQGIVMSGTLQGERRWGWLLLAVSVMLWVANGELLPPVLPWSGLLLLTACAVAGWYLGALRPGPLPAGDLLLLIDRGWRSGLRFGQWLGEALSSRRELFYRGLQAGWRRLACYPWLQKGEAWLGRWERAIILLLLVGLVIAVL